MRIEAECGCGAQFRAAAPDDAYGRPWLDSQFGRWNNAHSACAFVKMIPVTTGGRMPGDELIYPGPPVHDDPRGRFPNGDRIRPEFMVDERI